MISDTVTVVVDVKDNNNGGLDYAVIAANHRLSDGRWTGWRPIKKEIYDGAPRGTIAITYTIPANAALGQRCRDVAPSWRFGPLRSQLDRVRPDLPGQTSNMPASKRLTGVATVALLVLSSILLPSSASAGGPRHLPEHMVHAVKVKNIREHLVKLQRFADRSEQSRAAYTRGFTDSHEYFAKQLRKAGFNVTVQEFNWDRRVVDAATVEVGPVHVVPFPIINSPLTPVGGVRGPLMAAVDDASPGCELSDYVGDFRGAIAIINRGTCTFDQKQRIAADAGAVAAVIYSNVEGPGRGILPNPATGRIPVALTSRAEGLEMLNHVGQEALVEIRSHNVPSVSRNLIAETRTGNKDNVVLAGAQLDSEDEVPGINDNGTGSAALLEFALRLGPRPRINNAVRFVFWGSEWTQGGARAYLSTLTPQTQAQIALYLNIDHIGSRNGGFFVFDGDNNEAVGGPPRPPGSAAIEKSFQDYYATRGIPTEGTNWDASSDHTWFLLAGIPSGGIHTGSFRTKSEAQAAKWGGSAGSAFDPCHQTVCDNFDNVDFRMLDRNADAMAYVLASYAMSTAGVNTVLP